MAANNSTRTFDELFDDLVRCETRLYNALGETLRAEHGIGTSQFEMLRFIRHRPDTRVADAATNFAAGIGAVSKMTDRLVAAGWVVRSVNPDDRRSSLLNLTAIGAKLVTAAENTFARRLEQLVTETLSTRQVQSTATALHALRHSLETGGLGTPAG